MTFEIGSSISDYGTQIIVLLVFFSFLFCFCWWELGGVGVGNNPEQDIKTRHELFALTAPRKTPAISGGMEFLGRVKSGNF